MTEEQKAEEYKESKRHKSFRVDVGNIQINYESYLNNLRQAFIDGYSECEKEHEWHDLRKDPNDLPKDITSLYLVRVYSWNTWVYYLSKIRC